MPINISGTSLSAPQVTNLAGKILAVNPKLTVAQVRAIIEGTATSEGPRGLKVINPAAAMERARRS
jgi:subtilisin family serine protease